MLPQVAAFEPLGSKVPSQCIVSKHECPSHYMCVSPDAVSSRGTCVCDRFFGFFGSECRQLSIASYLLLFYCGVIITTSLFSLYYCFVLLWVMQSKRKLKSGIVSSTLILNAIAILSPCGIFGGYTLIVLEVDKNSYFVEHLEVILKR